MTIRRLPDTTPAVPPAGAAPRTPPAGAPAAGTRPAALTAPVVTTGGVQPGPASAAPLPPGRSQVVVRPGDSFWRIAARHERQRLGRRPTAAEVAVYWRPLVATNRHRLQMAGNPNLIFPGQVMQLP